MAAPWYLHAPSSRATMRDELVDGPLDVVVLDHVVELGGLLELAPRRAEPLADLAGALGRALAQPALELLDAARR